MWRNAIKIIFAMTSCIFQVFNPKKKNPFNSCHVILMACMVAYIFSAPHRLSKNSLPLSQNLSFQKCDKVYLRFFRQKKKMLEVFSFLFTEMLSSQIRQNIAKCPEQVILFQMRLHWVTSTDGEVSRAL